MDEPRSEEELFYPISRGALKETTARAGIRQSNLTQIIPTANKFEILAKINDSSEEICLKRASIVSSVTSIKSKKMFK
jgi:hypothetical protein